ncbi:DUF2059 domain-containing protein [Roseateles sp. BYS87W]|uniref:DUF2059 domain-containing protein n=1 Tax=Pelomonas baiyunensis TaxID=3299026 RepID=A0ABW7H247_9BURK
MTALVWFIAPAQASTRNEKLLQLVEVTQVTAAAQLSIDRQVASDKAQVQQALQQLIDRARPAPLYVAQLQEAADVFAADLKAPIEAREIADVWAQSFAKDFSDEELDQLLAFYGSPLGQRAIRAGQAASGAMAEFVQASQLVRAGKANEKLQRRLAEIARDCNCAPR